MKSKRNAGLRTILAMFAVAALLLALGSFAAAQMEAPPPPPPGPGPGMEIHGHGPMDMLMHDDMGGGKTVTGVPLSADLVVTRDTTLADGNRIHNENQTKVYRDSQGRVRREVGFELITPSTGGAKRQMIVITDPVAGKRYVLNPQTKTAHEMPLRPHDGKMRPHDEGAEGPMHDKANFNRQSLGTKSINGLQAEGTRMTHTIPAGKIGNEKPIEVVSERWFSTELQLPVLTTHNDPMMGTVTSKLTNVTRGEPDAALFQMPADYKIQTGKPGDLLYMPVQP